MNKFQKYNILFQKNPLPILIVDAINGDIVDSNELSKDFFKFSDDSLNEKNIYNLFKKKNLKNNIHLLLTEENILNKICYIDRFEKEFKLEIISFQYSEDEQKYIYLYIKNIQNNDCLDSENDLFFEKSNNKQTIVIELKETSKCKLCDLDIENIFNCSEQNIKFKKWFESIEKKDQKFIINKINELSLYKSSVQKIICKKGENADKISYSVKIEGKFSNHILARVIIIVNDLSNNQEIISELEEKRIFIERIAEHSPNIIYVYDIEQDKNIYINRDLKKVLGYKEDELPDESISIVSELIHPDDKVQFEGYEFKIRNWTKEYIQKFDMRLKAKDGLWRWFIGREGEFLRKEGKIVNIVGVLTDITELKKTEERIQEAQKIAKMGYWNLDLKTQEIFWSDEVYNIFGVKKSDRIINYEFFLSFVPEEEHEIFDKAIKNHIENGEKPKIEHKIMLNNGEIKYIQERCSAEFDKNGDAVRCTGTVLDISEQIKISEELKKLNKKLKVKNIELIKVKDEAVQSDRLKTEFLRNLSHEIRTPMNGIIGFAEMLNDDNLEMTKISYYSKMILISSRQLLRIIDDILEISRLETKQIVIRSKEISINEFLDNIFSVFDSMAKKRGILLYIKKRISDEEGFVSIDEVKLYKIISNLIENAFKYTNQGYVEIGNLIENDKLLIYVKDTGIGIAKEKQEQIFDRFQRAEDNLNKVTEGIGLGLAIAKENVKLLNGDIRVDSDLGKGSTFTVILPYDKISKVKKENRRVKPMKTNKKILIAEDEEINFVYLELLIRKKFKDVEIHLAQNGKEAIELCEKEDYSLVFMDVKMPVMNGLDATVEIMKFKPDLPIIGLTAYSTEEDKEMVFDAGCVGFISKPLDKEKVFSYVESYIQGNQ